MVVLDAGMDPMSGYRSGYAKQRTTSRASLKPLNRIVLHENRFGMYWFLGLVTRAHRIAGCIRMVACA